MSQLLHGNCLELMKDIPDGSIDMILCDLPYGTTACKWDTVIPFEPLWEQYKRVIKGSGAIVLTASQPFTSALVMSNAEWFKYEIIWEKTMPSGVMHAKNMPLKVHEAVLVFSRGSIAHSGLSSARMKYFPEMQQGPPYQKLRKKHACKDGCAVFGNRPSHVDYLHANDGTRYPRDVVRISNSNHNSIHPTQKPVALFEYLIKTYTLEGETVLDNCAGSGTTAIACINTNREYICMELDEAYFNKAKQRIAEHLTTPKQCVML